MSHNFTTRSDKNTETLVKDWKSDDVNKIKITIPFKMSAGDESALTETKASKFWNSYTTLTVLYAFAVFVYSGTLLTLTYHFVWDFRRLGFLRSGLFVSFLAGDRRAWQRAARALVLSAIEARSSPPAAQPLTNIAHPPFATTLMLSLLCLFIILSFFTGILSKSSI